MPVRQVKITNETGMHARPSQAFVKLAQNFEEDIKVVLNNQEADAKSIMAVMSLAASYGDVIKIISSNQEAINELAKLVKNNFSQENSG